jgi:hypothetical protein
MFNYNDVTHLLSMPMKRNKLLTKQESQLINAGLRARALRKQLAVTWLASQEIIDAMRALRAGIPLPNKTQALEQEVKNAKDIDQSATRLD